MTIDTKSLLNWVGGKRLLRKTIEPLVPKDIMSYIEPFGGAGWVLFYKNKIPTPVTAIKAPIISIHDGFSLNKKYEGRIIKTGVIDIIVEAIPALIY